MSLSEPVQPVIPHRESERTPWREPMVFGSLSLLLLTLAMYGRFLFAAGPIVVSLPKSDAWNSWYSRAFAFDCLRQGHIPLWNPYILSGNPYLGDFQSTLLYPPNWQYVLLPIARAINLEVMVSVFLGGLWMYLWALRRRLAPVAALVAASAFMFGAPMTLQIFAGHLNPVDAACWIPLLFWMGDELRRCPRAKHVLIGTAAVALQILAGFPQYVFYTAIAMALLTVFEWSGMAQRWPSIGCLIAIYIGGAAISAAQLLTSFDAARETSRSHVAYSFASSVSLPPENLLTLLSPSILGDVGTMHYWGRWQPWEVNLFMGSLSLLLAVWALAGTKGRRHRFAFQLGGCAAILMLFALGQYTPVFEIFYDHVPGFAQFRVPARFDMPATALLGMLAGVGVDALIAFPIRARRAARCILGATVPLIILGLLIPSVWPRIVLAVASTGQAFFPSAHYTSQAFINSANDEALGSLRGVLALWALVAAAVLWRPGRKPDAAAGTVVALLAIGEVLLWSYQVLPSFDLRDTLPTTARRVLESHPGDYRYFRLTRVWDNSAMGMHTYDLWGYESLKLRRYSEFMAWTQGRDPNDLGYDTEFTRNSPLWSMLRCRYIFVETNGAPEIHERNDYLPHVLLLTDWKQVVKRDAIFAAMSSPGFDPSRQVILESRPDPLPAAPSATPVGSASIVESGTDFLTIDANVGRPAILLVTDSYARGWHAVGLDGSAQQNYSVMPANYILRAIPLRAGAHRIRLYYLPIGFAIGGWISILSLLAYFGSIVCLFRRRRAGHAEPQKR